MESQLEYKTVRSEYVLDSYNMNSSFDLVSKLLPLAMNAAKARVPLVLNWDKVRWPGLDKVVSQITRLNVTVFDHSSGKFCWRQTRRPYLSANLSQELMLKLRERVVVANSTVSSVVFYNDRGVLDQFGVTKDLLLDVIRQQFEPVVGTLHNMTLEEKIAVLSTAKAMVSSDDESEIVHALWMPLESPVIILQTTELGNASSAVSFLKKYGRKVVYVGSASSAGATNADPEQEQGEVIAAVPWEDDSALVDGLRSALDAI
jgi:hypothetical protein